MLSGVYRFPAMENVVFGKPFGEALAHEADRLDARAIFILASGTLARATDTIDRLRQFWETGSPGSAQRSVRTHRGPMLSRRQTRRAMPAPICS